jgi:hypothetical protein
VPGAFDFAAQTVREDDVVTQMPCGPDIGRYLAGIGEFEAAGFAHVGLVHVSADGTGRIEPVLIA